MSPAGKDPEDPGDAGTDAQVSGDGSRGESDWQRRRRLAEVFGDVLPETTSDEREPGSAPGQRESAADAWLREQVPPHHGQK